MSATGNSMTMPFDLAEVRAALQMDVVLVHRNWHIFRELYGTKETVDLLNFGGQAYFGISQIIWAEHVQMAISRLTDALKIGMHENLCLNRLLLHIDRANHPGLHRQVESLLKELEILCKPIRDRRMKLFAHADLDTKLGRNSTPLNPVSRRIIDSTLAKIREIMNAVELAYIGSPTEYGFNIDSAEQELLLRLNDAREYERQERVRDGLPPDPEVRREL